MKIVKYLIIGLTSLFLFACANNSNKIARNNLNDYQRVALAKQEYRDGMYKKAFNDLLISAEHGNADAQYALGYMYYYGKGVPRNTEKASYLFKLAMQQGHHDAIEAMSMIINTNGIFTTNKKRKPLLATNSLKKTLEPNKFRESKLQNKDLLAQRIQYRERSQNNVAKFNSKKVKNKNAASNNALSKNMLAYKEENSLAKAKAVTIKSKKSMQSNYYTIQLIADPSQNIVETFSSRNHFTDSMHKYKYVYRGATWYALSLGSYDNYTDAKHAIGKLPQNIKNMHPWVRKINGKTGEIS